MRIAGQFSARELADLPGVMDPVEFLDRYPGKIDPMGHFGQPGRYLNAPSAPTGLETLDLIETPELPRPYDQFDQLRQQEFILKNPASGISLLPGGEQGPAQGPNIPIKNYGGRYMPDATQPTGYRPGPIPLA